MTYDIVVCVLLPFSSLSAKLCLWHQHVPHAYIKFLSRWTLYMWFYILYYLYIFIYECVCMCLNCVKSVQVVVCYFDCYMTYACHGATHIVCARRNELDHFLIDHVDWIFLSFSSESRYMKRNMYTHDVGRMCMRLNKLKSVLSYNPYAVVRYETKIFVRTMCERTFV